MSNEDAPRSFWKTLPGILTGVAAVLTAVGGLLVALQGVGFFDRAPAARPAEIGARAPEPGGATRSGDGGCLDRLFATIAPGRRASAEEGALNVALLADGEPRRGPIGLRLTDGGNVIGGLVLAFHPDGEIFKIDRAVDPLCADVASARNASRPTGRTLQNWDDLEIVLGGRRYVLRFGYTGERLELGSFHRAAD